MENEEEDRVKEPVKTPHHPWEDLSTVSTLILIGYSSCVAIKEVAKWIKKKIDTILN